MRRDSHVVLSTSHRNTSRLSHSEPISDKIKNHDVHMSFFQDQLDGEKDQDLFDSVLMDSGSTFNIFCNSDLVTGIQHCGSEGINVHSNGGIKHVKMIANQASLGEVWYN